MDGTPIFDLVDVPDSDNCLLVSNLSSYRGIVLSNINNIKLTDAPLDMNKKKDIKISNLALFNKLRMTKKKKTMKELKSTKFKRHYEMSKKEYFEKYEKNFKDNTFVEENISVIDWEYRSDNEDTKLPVGRKLHEDHPTRNEMLIYFTEIWAANKEKYLRSLLRCDSDGNLKKRFTRCGKAADISLRFGGQASNPSPFFSHSPMPMIPCTWDTRCLPFRIL